MNVVMMYGVVEKEKTLESQDQRRSYRPKLVWSLTYRTRFFKLEVSAMKTSRT